jgi:hypothetical protein
MTSAPVLAIPNFQLLEHNTTCVMHTDRHSERLSLATKNRHNAYLKLVEAYEQDEEQNKYTLTCLIYRRSSITCDTSHYTKVTN